ncbi:MAG: deoxyribodipyrimidine photo-lyase [Legionellaceae bacterium]|nr:deoxyribodipyrimidine photo-lyase [Legionellaceae bacterium]
MSIQIIQTSQKNLVSIMWFRRDLRISDNPALAAAVKKGAVLPIYIHDETTPKAFQLGETSQLWLYYALEALNQTLHHALKLYIGRPEEIIAGLTQKYQVTHVFWNNSHEPHHQKTDETIKKLLRSLNIQHQVFHSNYLWKPTDILKKDYSYYKVFSAYKRKALQVPLSEVTPPPQALTVLKNNLDLFKDTCHKIFLTQPWHHKIKQHWQIGEVNAYKQLQFFIENHLDSYHQQRDYPAANSTSRLSPHLHFGEISPLTIWKEIEKKQLSCDESASIECYFSEIIWREFSAYLTYHFNQLHQDNFNTKFNNFPWAHNTHHLKAWQMGQTGYPFVDAGMRELWQTGFMHNRVRMVVASFLVKNLMIHWHEGRDWFWNCLVDADLENNSASWQWVAGSGADAAPYFRIFNPITQGKKFDPDGSYTKTYIPELAKLPTRYLFQPWCAPSDVLKQAGIILGETYPKPIIDLSTSRQQALAAYQSLS